MRAFSLLLAASVAVWAQNAGGSASDGTTPLHWAVHDNDADHCGDTSLSATVCVPDSPSRMRWP